MSKEKRAHVTPLEVRGENDAQALNGYAAVFNSKTDICPFTEEIAPGAFKNLSDVRALWNHDSNHPIGRMGKNLTLKEDERGLSFELEPVNETGRRVMEDVRSGIVDGMSFGFQVTRDEWESRDGEKDHRIIREVELWEISPVTFPAYKDTEVDLRSHEAFRQEVEGCDVAARKRRLNMKAQLHKLAR